MSDESTPQQFVGPAFNDFDNRTGVERARLSHLRFFEGEGGGGEGGDPPAGDPPAGDPPAGDPPAGDPENVDISTLPEPVQKIIRDARNEAAKYRTERNDERTKAQTAEQQKSAVLKALGLESDEPDVDALQKTIADKDSALRSLRIENAFGKVAKANGADEELTLAVLSRNGVIGNLDPDASDFTTQLEAEVKKAVEANPKLKVTQVAPKGGSNGFDGDGGGRSNTPVSFADAVTKALS